MEIQILRSKSHAAFYIFNSFALVKPQFNVKNDQQV